MSLWLNQQFTLHLRGKKWAHTAHDRLNNNSTEHKSSLASLGQKYENTDDKIFSVNNSSAVEYE